VAELHEDCDLVTGSRCRLRPPEAPFDREPFGRYNLERSHSGIDGSLRSSSIWASN
jgi:hypothetical protein